MLQESFGEFGGNIIKVFSWTKGVYSNKWQGYQYTDSLKTGVDYRDRELGRGGGDTIVDRA